MKHSKTAHAFLIDGVRSRCCTKDEDEKRVVLRADAKTFGVRVDQDAVFLIWKSGVSGNQIIATFKRPAFGAIEREDRIEVFLESGVPTGRNTVENFHQGANSQGSDVNVFDPAGKVSAAVGDAGRGHVTVPKVQATIEKTRRVWGVKS